MLTSVMGLRKIGCGASLRVRRQLLWFVLVTASVFLPEYVGATHVIGGDLRYRCLGNNQYEIILTWRRDCFLGDPGTEFEAVASIGFFNLTTGAPLEFIGPGGLLLIPRNPIDTATQLFISDCTLAGQDICVEQTVYIDTVTLMPFQPGYKIVYQRCCRNASLNNVEDPLNTGMTLVAELSFQAQQVCNSSPVLGDFPPIYICVNKDINFDFLATDPDGDSLVFEFFTPFLGASDQFPQPSPPPPPPYTEIEWNDPPYNLNNLLGGIPLTIDRFTGHMAGTPNTIGQFLVGVKIFAYREGVLIETVTREWQYNVRPCHDTPVSDFLVNTNLNCDSLSISFTEQTQFADEFRWIFDYGDPNSPTSAEMNPTFEFTEPGFYNVALIVNDSDSICFDTSYMNVGVFLSEAAADFELDVPTCDESITLDVLDTSQDPDPNYDIVAWQYVLTDSTGTDTTNLQNPQFLFDEDEAGLNLLLTVTSSNGCTATFDTTFDVQLLRIDFKGDTAGVCDGDSVALFNEPGDTNLIYMWSPITDLDISNPANPIAFPGKSTEYFVTVTDGLCEVNDSVLVAVQELPGLAFSTDTDCRSLLLTTLNTSDPPGFNYLWDFGDSTALVPGDSPDHTYEKPGEYIVTLLSADGCDVQISQGITVNIIDDPVDGEEISCFAEAVVLNPVSVPGYLYQWEPSEFLNNDTLGSPTAQVDVTTTFSVTITDPALPGCSIMEVIEVVVPPDFELSGPPDSAYCDAPTIVLNAGNSDVDYEWFILGGPLLNEGPELVVTPQVETTYEVVGTDDFGCEKRDTFTLSPTFFDLSASTDTIICLGDSIQISITNNDPSQDLSYVWSPAGSIVPPSTPNDTNPIVKPGSSEVYTVQVTNNVLGCVTTEEVRVDVSTFMLEYSPSVLICKGESISLNIAGETDNLIFSWEPIDQIDSGADTPNPVVSPEETTVYTAHVVNTDYGCETDLEVTVNVSWFIPESLEIYVNRDTVILGDTVFVLNTNQVDPLLEFLWSGHPGIEPNPTSHEITVTPTAGGGFSINLTVTNPDGCELNGSIALTVLDPPCDDSTVFVPDAFSPNDDNANDEFQVFSNFIQSMDLYIYNRWGELVFEAHNQNEHWDGTYKGEKLHPDVFGYYLNVICIPDKPFSKKGNITLFR